MPLPNPFRDYQRELRGKLDLGIAMEHTPRPALKLLPEAAVAAVAAANEPRRIDCGAFGAARSVCGWLPLYDRMDRHWE